MPCRLLPGSIRLILVALSALLTPHLLAQRPGGTSAPEVSERIRRVEQNLLRAVQIQGERTYSIQERMNHYRVPGLSVAVINGGRIEWAKGYGWADADSTVPVTTSTLFQAASISKPVAALAALHAVEQGTVALDADINSYLKDWQIPSQRFTQSEKVTLRRLLTHTAGLTVHGFPGYSAGKPLPTTGQILNGEPPANTRVVLPDTVPGRLWRYSGGGYIVMQKVLEDQLGRPFDQIAAETVLSKLGMTNSTFEQPLPARLATQAAMGFYGSGRPVPGQWHTYPEKAAAGLWTTPTDLARYVLEVQQSLQGKSNRVISAAMTRQMLTPDRGWGLGPAVMQRGDDTLYFRHGGANVGFRCELVANAHTGQAAIVMTNGQNGSALAEELVRSIADVYGWGAFKSRTVVRMVLAPEQLAAMKGTYQFQGRRITIRPEGEYLRVRVNLDPELELLPLPNHEFIAPENGLLLKAVRNDVGQVTSLVLQGTTFRRME